MIFEALPLSGCYRIEIPYFLDARGDFLKIFDIDLIRQVAPDFEVAEAYCTTSDKEVVRGMHFQRPPHDHVKVVSLTSGAALDVLVDLRAGEDFGKTCSVELSLSETGTLLVIDRGVGHGFLSRTENCRLNYLVSTRYAPDHDDGILWSSIDFSWPVKTPILSDRDQNHPRIGEMQPFL